MDKKDEEIQSLVQLESKVKNIENHNQGIIKELAGLQLDITTTKMGGLSEKVGELFSHASKIEEALKKIADDMQIEINRLKAGN